MAGARRVLRRRRRSGAVFDGHAFKFRVAVFEDDGKFFDFPFCVQNDVLFDGLIDIGFLIFIVQEPAFKIITFFFRFRQVCKDLALFHG